MSKVILTISTKYLPNWGTYEGVRELIQNAKDAEVEHHAPMKVTHTNEVLRIENEGTTLPLKALLLGHTTKLGNSEMIGHFGEGLKLSCLALLRAGHNVKIRNGSEVWVPQLEMDDRFGEEVISFDIHSGREAKNRIRFEVDGITKAKWEELKTNFLFLDTKGADDRVSTYGGQLLLDPKFKGKIFVKGIFVQNDPGMHFGFDITRDAELDRDRRMIESWNLKYLTRGIFSSALATRLDLFPTFDDLLATPTTETEGFDENSYGLPEAAIDHVYAKFIERHGPDAIPVQSLAESKDVEHLGMKGMIVSKQLGGILAKKFGNLYVLKDRLSKECLKEYSWDDLSEPEQNNLTSGLSLVNDVVSLALSEVKVVDFRSENLEGQFKDGVVFIGKKHLENSARTLEILVHEVAHRAGADGDHSHVARIERIWSGIVTKLRAG